MKRGSGCCAVDVYRTAALTSFSNSIRLHNIFIFGMAYSRLYIRILRVVSLLGKKFIFFNSPGTTRILKLSVYTRAFLLDNFPEHAELCFYFKYVKEVTKFDDLGDKVLKQTLRLQSVLINIDLHFGILNNNNTSF